ncbi:hypothetical protein B5M42_010695 [Paenibacillus athensensis]|uniref:Uncharacterized protein n=1 Tax=Paenibacillus athensensis TaxID=1967502 RepID=A0A4Y8PYU1_9BACL|nr:hypothetical protein [Paenibacillus athensensis]MCD1259304.1 hypothetical protein [Paenibacillus athensensis]
MSIKLSKLYQLDSRGYKYFEKVSEDLILFNLEIKGDSLHFDSRPVHWRCDFGDFPPMDISLDSATGLLKEITVFIKKSDIKKQDREIHLDILASKGYPTFSTDIWKKHEYYYDESVGVNIFILELNLCVCLAKSKIQNKLKVNDVLDVLLDEQDFLSGFIINNLSVDELKYMI